MSIIRSARSWAPLAMLATGTLLAGAAQAHNDHLTVARDPATGQLRAPSATEAAALATRPRALPSRPGAQAPAPVTPALRKHRNGMTNARLTDDFATYVVVTRQADGSLHEVCVEGADAARTAVNTAAAIPAKVAAPSQAKTEWATE